jgi:hypothetical protein
MAAKSESGPKSMDAKLFWNGRSQAVRRGVLIEPLPPVEKETVEEWFARLDAMKGDPLFPEGRKQNLAPIHEYFK